MSPSRFVFDAIGTHWTIDIYSFLSEDSKNLILKKIKDRIEIFDKNYSRFREDSLITKISKKPGRYKLPADAKQMLDLYQKLYTITDGYVTPLIGNTLSQAGYDKNYSLKPKNLTPINKWEDTIEYKFPNLVVKKPVILDFGAAGKGYLIDIIGNLLIENKISQFCIDAGGDILYKNTDSLRVGLEDPNDPKKVIGVANIKNQSICGSAGNRRNWGKFHHIINPKTLNSPTNIAAVWVISDSTLVADGLSTCLFFTKAQELKKHFSFEYVIVYSDLSVEISDNFPGEIFVND